MVEFGGLLGRAPVMADLDAAAIILGYVGGCDPDCEFQPTMDRMPARAAAGCLGDAGKFFLLTECHPKTAGGDLDSALAAPMRVQIKTGERSGQSRDDRLREGRLLAREPSTTVLGTIGTPRTVVARGPHTAQSRTLAIDIASGIAPAPMSIAAIGSSAAMVRRFRANRAAIQEAISRSTASNSKTDAQALRGVAAASAT